MPRGQTPNAASSPRSNTALSGSDTTDNNNEEFHTWNTNPQLFPAWAEPNSGQYSDVAIALMIKMGWVKGQGIGKHSQGTPYLLSDTEPGLRLHTRTVIRTPPLLL